MNVCETICIVFVFNVGLRSVYFRLLIKFSLKKKMFPKKRLVVNSILNKEDNDVARFSEVTNSDSTTPPEINLVAEIGCNNHNLKENSSIKCHTKAVLKNNSIPEIKKKTIKFKDFLEDIREFHSSLEIKNSNQNLKEILSEKCNHKTILKSNLKSESKLVPDVFSLEKIKDELPLETNISEEHNAFLNSPSYYSSCTADYYEIHEDISQNFQSISQNSSNSPVVDIPPPKPVYQSKDTKYEKNCSSYSSNILDIKKEETFSFNYHSLSNSSRLVSFSETSIIYGPEEEDYNNFSVEDVSSSDESEMLIEPISWCLEKKK